MKPAKPGQQGGLRLLWRLGPWILKHKRLFLTVLALAPLSAGLQMALPNLIRLVIDKGMLSRDTEALTGFTALFVGAFLADFCVRSLQRYWTAVLVQKTVRDLRQDLTNRLVSLPAAFHDGQISGVLVTRATSDFDALNESLGHGVFGALADMVTIGGSLAALFLIAGPLALVALCILPLVGLVTGLCARALQRAMLAARARLAELNGFTQECITAMPAIRSLNAGKDTGHRYDRASLAYRDAQMKSVVLDAVLYSVVEGLAAIALGVLLWLVSGDLVTGVSAGVLIASVSSLQQIFEPLKEFTNRIALLQGVFTALERIFGLMDVRIKSGGSIVPTCRKGELEIRELRFSYDPVESGREARMILEELSVSVTPGQSLALVGATGCGKTTLMRLLAGEYDTYQGSVRIDGQEVAQLDPALHRASLGIVPQDPEIFAGSIEFNISLGRRGVTRDAVRRAAESVGAARFIERLPEGYETILEENGANLSQGQRQLVVFARAIVTEPAMLLLDEATSSLDPESEHLVQAAMDALFVGRTVVVIAHRLSTVERCDRIVVLENGRVAESGTHQQLLHSRGVYCAMVRSFVDRKKRT